MRFYVPLRSGWLKLLGGLCLLAGCGGESITAVPVSGRVTLDGQPLAGAHVSFQPQPSEADPDRPVVGSYGTTDAEGRFDLRLVAPDQSGAMPGTHRVRLSTARAEGTADESSPLTPERVPLEYRDGSLTFDVPPEGTAAANFELRSPPAP